MSNIITRFPIGYTFTKSIGMKQPRECTVADHLTTTNAAGEVVMFRYVTSHVSMGQTVLDRDVVHVTIQRNSL